MKYKFLILVTFIGYSLLGQNDNYYDKLLLTLDKAYHEVDFELANTIFPFVKKRFLEHLKDTTSFYNPFDSLSK